MPKKCPKKDCELVLTPVQVNLSQTSVVWSIGSCFAKRKITVVYTTVYTVSSVPVIKTHKLKITVDKNGEFFFDIPSGTTALSVKVTIKVGDKCECNPFKIHTTAYSPAPCKSLFEDEYMSERIMFNHLSHRIIATSGLDHTAPGIGEARVQHQTGPGKSSRAMAISYIAMFECVLAVLGGYVSYLGLAKAPKGTSIEAAMAQSVHDTLKYLYPSQTGLFNTALTAELATIHNGSSKTHGIALGKAAATAIIALRSSDGSALSSPEPKLDTHGGPYVQGAVGSGLWRQDPISLKPVAMGAYWDQVETFVVPAANTFRAPPPPALSSTEFGMAYDEVMALGGDGTITATVRDQNGTNAGLFWAYDGVPVLCAPAGLYNQVAEVLITDANLSFLQMARAFAILNTTMADVGISAWEAKYHYKLGRPITVIREATGASNYGNPMIVGDTNYTPLGAPATFIPAGVDFTPPFPAYPSGHATFGGAIFQILRTILGSDNIPFTFTSNELNGTTLDNNGNVRPLAPRSFTSLSQAEEENGQSRIYLGIHWSFDKTEGIKMGRNIADYVLNNLYLPA